MEEKPYVHFRPTTLPPNPNTVTSPLRPASIRKGASASLKQDIMINNTLTSKSHYTSTQCDFDLDSGTILHVTAHTFEALWSGSNVFFTGWKSKPPKDKSTNF